jgi:hypothetical protein
MDSTETTIKIIFSHSQEGLKTAIRRNLGVRNFLFEKVRNSDGSYHTEVHIPGFLLPTYKQLLEPVFKTYGEPENLSQHSGAMTGCCSYIDGVNHRSLSSCMDEKAQNGTGILAGLAKNFMQGADKMTSISSIAANVMSAFVETRQSRPITVYCMVENSEPKTIELSSFPDLDQFMQQVEQTLFPWHFGQTNCNYPRFAFDRTKPDQYLALTSSDFGSVKEVLVVGSREIEAFKIQHPRKKAFAGNDLSSTADSGNQTLDLVNAQELELKLKIEQERSKREEDKAQQIALAEKEKTRQAEEKTKQVVEQEKTKQMLIEYARDQNVDLAEIMKAVNNR